MNLLDQTNEDQLEIDENKNYLEELVGENNKFKTVEDLARGKAVSDNYITILEGRLDAMREEYKKVRDENTASPKLQDLIDKYEDLSKQLTSRNNQQSNEDSTKAAYDPKQVESLIDSRVQAIEQGNKEKANFKLVQDKLTERYGSNYKNVLKDQSNQLGLTDDDVNSMARKNPNLFMKTFDLTTPQRSDTFQTPPRSDRRSDTFAPRAPEKHTMSYYEGLRKKDPQAWMNKKIAVQMEKDAQALGKEFFDT